MSQHLMLAAHISNTTYTHPNIHLSSLLSREILLYATFQRIYIMFAIDGECLEKQSTQRNKATVNRAQAKFFLFYSEFFQLD